MSQLRPAQVYQPGHMPQRFVLLEVSGEREHRGGERDQGLHDQRRSVAFLLSDSVVSGVSQKTCDRRLSHQVLPGRPVQRRGVPGATSRLPGDGRRFLRGPSPCDIEVGRGSCGAFCYLGVGVRPRLVAHEEGA